MKKSFIAIALTLAMVLTMFSGAISVQATT